MHFSRRVFRKAVLAHGPIQQPKNIHGMNPKAYVSINRIFTYKFNSTATADTYFLMTYYPKKDFNF